MPRPADPVGRNVPPDEMPAPPWLKPSVSRPARQASSNASGFLSNVALKRRSKTQNCSLPNPFEQLILLSATKLLDKHTIEGYTLPIESLARIHRKLENYVRHKLPGDFALFRDPARFRASLSAESSTAGALAGCGKSLFSSGGRCFTADVNYVLSTGFSP